MDRSGYLAGVSQYCPSLSSCWFSISQGVANDESSTENSVRFPNGFMYAAHEIRKRKPPKSSLRISSSKPSRHQVRFQWFVEKVVRRHN